MHQIRRIIEIQNEGRSIRETERLTGLSRNTIREYLRRISLSSGLATAQLLSMDDESSHPLYMLKILKEIVQVVPPMNNTLL